ncbi:MAG: hypothetical protein MRJ96_14470 [Nitrospirales bacterium]|nr:hypothetical protein [Nitrospira sp.]MDR4502645.1 hypothetical protein [Nitrospirales bacterium]
MSTIVKGDYSLAASCQCWVLDVSGSIASPILLPDDVSTSRKRIRTFVEGLCCRFVSFIWFGKGNRDSVPTISYLIKTKERFMLTKKMIVLLGITFFCTAFYFHPLHAETFSGYAKVQIITIDKSQAPKTDIGIQAKFTGKGGPMRADEEKLLIVRESDFGPSGVNRIQSLALAALLAGKTLWVDFDLRNRDSPKGHLLRLDIRP